MPLYLVGDIWYINIQHRGQRIRESTRTSDRQEAQEYHDRRKAELWRTVEFGDPAPREFREAIVSWLKEKPRDLSDRYRLNALPAWLLRRRLSALTTQVLDEAIAHMGPSSYNRTANLLTAILNHAAGRGWMVTVPKLPRRKVDDKRVRWLTAEEWDRLRAALPQPWERMARFSVSTGLRENNVLGLRWDQIDRSRRVAWIHSDEAKGRDAIGVPLNADAMAVLAEIDPEASPWVFPNPVTGRPYYKASGRTWYRATKEAGLEGVRWHDLRHTFAAWAVMNGVSLQELMDLGGWKSYSMVLRYAHLSPEHLATAASRIKPVGNLKAYGK